MLSSRHVIALTSVLGDRHAPQMHGFWDFLEGPALIAWDSRHASECGKCTNLHTTFTENVLIANTQRQLPGGAGPQCRFNHMLSDKPPRPRIIWNNVQSSHLHQPGMYCTNLRCRGDGRGCT